MKLNGSLKTNGSPSKKNGNPFGNDYHTWRRLQHGQEKIVRFGRYVNDPEFGHLLRKQNGHEHRCSVSLVLNCEIVRIRPYAQMDEVLLHLCVSGHDEPEGVSEVDLPAPLKTDNDDLKEYAIFEQLYKPLGPDVWRDMQRAFLLQFCLKNPPCFPRDARKVMAELAATRRNEALFFDGIQRLDYLYYAYECFAERKVRTLLEEVTSNQFGKLDLIADELPGFGKVTWSPKRREFFQRFIKKQAVLNGH